MELEAPEGDAGAGDEDPADGAEGFGKAIRPKVLSVEAGCAGER